MVQWIKFDVNFFDSTRAVELFENSSGYRDISVYIKLLCLAGKLNMSGRFVSGEGRVYTEATLKKLLKLTARSFRSATAHLIEVGLLGLDRDGYFIPEWSKLQNETALSKMREAGRHGCMPKKETVKDKEREKDKEADKEKEKESNSKSSLCFKDSKKTLNTREKGRDPGNYPVVTEKNGNAAENRLAHDEIPEDVKRLVKSGEVALTDDEFDELREKIGTRRLCGSIRLIGKYMKPFGKTPGNAYRFIANHLLFVSNPRMKFDQAFLDYA